MYIACVCGILLGPFVPDLIAGNPLPSSAILQWSKIICALILAFVILAGLYKTILDPKVPLVAQIGYAIIAGFVSQKIAPLIIDGVAKIFTG
jgi:hypothetical protein